MGFAGGFLAVCPGHGHGTWVGVSSTTPLLGLSLLGLGVLRGVVSSQVHKAQQTQALDLGDDTISPAGNRPTRHAR